MVLKETKCYIRCWTASTLVEFMDTANWMRITASEETRGDFFMHERSFTQMLRELSNNMDVREVELGRYGVGGSWFPELIGKYHHAIGRTEDEMEEKAKYAQLIARGFGQWCGSLFAYKK